MLSLEEEQRILENAPPYLRVAIVLLAQTGGRTYTEGFSLRWDQIDFDHKVMFFGGDTKTEGSSEPVPLTGLAHDVLLSWKKEQADRAHFFFQVRSWMTSRLHLCGRPGERRLRRRK
jgi:integrase